MFKVLKQKIAKETGQNVDDINFHNNNSRHSISLDSKDETYGEDVISSLSIMTLLINYVHLQREAEINILRNDLLVAQSKIKSLEHDKFNLEESLRVCQMQREMIVDETDKIQNFQHQEISKLKNLLLFREQVGE